MIYRMYVVMNTDQQSAGFGQIVSLDDEPPAAGVFIFQNFASSTKPYMLTDNNMKSSQT